VVINQRQFVGRSVLWLFCLLLGFSARVQALPATVLTVDLDSTPVQLEFLSDPGGQMNAGTIMRTAGWQQLETVYSNFGYIDHPVWYRFRLRNPDPRRESLILAVTYPLLDYLTLYEQDEQGLHLHAATGDELPYAQRPLDHPYFLFPLVLEPGAERSFYLRLETGGAHLLPLDLWRETDLFVQLSKEDQLHAVYFGIVGVIIFFNLLIYIALRERMYLYYVCSTLMFMLFFAIMRGKIYPLIFSEQPDFHRYLLLVVMPGCLLFSSLFSREFLNLRHYSHTLDLLCRCVAGAMLFCMACIPFLSNQMSLQLSVAVAVPATFLLLLFGPILVMMGNRMAWVYLAAWSFLMFGSAVAALSKHGALPVNFLTEFGMQIGSALEAFIFNAALAFRFYREHQDRISAQQARLRENAERREAELKLLQASMSDPVTLMPNRLCFERQITRLLEARRQERIAVVVIEIRRYGEIKRSLGHHNADLVMCEVAHRMNGWFESLPGLVPIEGPSFKANLCALEQGNFGVLMYADQAESNYSPAGEVIRRMMKPVAYHGMRLSMNPSIGVAVCPEHGLNAATLLRNAQVAADSSEAHEKTLAYYRQEIDQSNAKRLVLISELRDAIRDDALELYFQPKWDFRKNRVVCVEALLRWQHERFGMVRPDEFVALAEQTGIIRLLTRWVIERALHYMERFHEQGFDIGMSINISALNLREPDLTDYLQSTIRSRRLDADSVFLELTETAMMQNSQMSILKLDNLRKTGLKISVDDFGSGFSSLSYLRSLPADEIKIDRSLTAYITTEVQSEIVMRKSIEMCHALGFEVVAEGVETHDMLELLFEMGCDQVQGYGISPPLPFDDLLYWLRHQSEKMRL
jgi:EAL domain-containing protein (putative c-di-GMP-specific phosphodiesterase class I)/GGDEF domain-containing protein